MVTSTKTETTKKETAATPENAATETATPENAATETATAENAATETATAENAATETATAENAVTKKGFFEQDRDSLEIAIDNDSIKAELAKYSQEELWFINDDDGFLVVKIPQFRGVNAHISRSVSRKTGLTFYGCDLFINSPLKHKVSSDLFDEGLYQDLLLRNENITSGLSEFDLPVRIRFVVGQSEKSLREDKLYFGIQIIFPGLNRIYTDFVNTGELDRINYLSTKSAEECKKQKIKPWNKKYSLFYVKNNDLVKNLWALEQPDYDY